MQKLKLPRLISIVHPTMIKLLLQRLVQRLLKLLLLQLLLL
jgi:hypothetical protein